MNNRLKFRVWNKISKAFLPQDLLNRVKFNYRCEVLDYYNNFRELGVYEEDGEYDCHGKTDENSIVQQFTGLTDKNGREIYEGDIVVSVSSDNKCLAQVIWNESSGGFGFLITINNNSKQILTYSCSDWEIRGNVLENPELIA